jgi:RsiW-degrading membrane proteinase PrsW (M82 family)
MAAINPTAPYTPKAGEEKKENLILPHPIWLAILFGIALVGGMMCFYILTRYGFDLVVFFFVDITFILCVLLPPFIWLAFLARLTRRNPIKMKTIYLVFGLGILSAVPALFINTLFGYHMGKDLAIASSAVYSAVILTAIIAPFNEEFCKALGLVFLREKIDTPMYGFIFGMTIGLGFSMVENANYEFFVLWQSFHFNPPYEIYMDESVHFSWGLVTFGRSVVGPIVHGLGVGLVGYATAYARERKKLAYLAIPLAYLCAVFIHGFWNGGNVYLSGAFLALFNIYLVIIYLVIIMVILYHLWKGRRLIETINKLFKQESKKKRSKGKKKPKHGATESHRSLKSKDFKKPSKG